jgi:predicted nucleotidyltransferase
MARKASTKLRRDIIAHYIDTLSQKIKVDGVLLFGSYAYGGANRHSDVDLVIISPDFAKQDFWSRVGWLSKMRDKPTYVMAMDIFGYTPEEFAKIENQSAIMAKAKKQGEWLQKPKSMLN